MKGTKRFNLKNFSSLAIIAALPSVTFCFFGPLEMFYLNIHQIWFPIRSAILTALICALLLIIVITAILYFLPDRIGKYFYAVFFGVGLASYVQGNYLQLDYGQLDGREINWSSYAMWAIINTLIWLLLIVASVIAVKIKTKKTQIIMRYISCVILAVQIGTLIFLGVTTDQRREQYTISTEGIYEVSDKQNIIIFLLDTFDTEFMTELINEDPVLIEKLKGFVFYDNTIGMYSYTRTAVPHILTGVKYLNEKSYSDYLDSAFSSSQLYSILDNSNFDTGIYTDSSIISSKISRYLRNLNLVDQTVRNYLGFAGTMYRFTATKYFPHVLKKSVWMYSAEFNQYRNSQVGEVYAMNDVQFYNAMMQNGLSFETDHNAFRFYHLYGAHPPYVYDGNVQPVRSSYYGALDQARGALQIVIDYIEYLKRADVYDNTLFIVMADHGDRAPFGNRPLLMIKDTGDTKEFTTSSLPVSYEDFMPMLESYVDKHTSPTEFLQNIAPNRDERFFYFSTGNGLWNQDYTPNMVEFVFVDGKSDPEMHMHATGIVYSAETDSIQKYKLGDTLYFSRSYDDSLRYFVSGLHIAEDSHTNTFGREAIFRAELDQPVSSDLRLEMTFFIHDFQTILLYSNDRLVEKVSFSRPGPLKATFIIPEDSISPDNTILLRFEFPNAHVVGGVPTYAIGIMEMTISENVIPQYRLGDSIHFSIDNNNAQKFFLHGLGSPEASHTWVDGSEAVFCAELDQPVTSDIRLDMTFFTSDFQSILLYSNNYLIDEMNFSVPGTCNAVFIIPRDVISADNILSLRFEFPNALVVDGEPSIAIGLIDMIISENIIPQYQLDDTIHFTRSSGNAQKYFLRGLGSPEESHTWSNGTDAVFCAKLLLPIASDLRLYMSFFITSFQTIKLYSSDFLLEEQSFSEPGNYSTVFIIPEDALSADNTLILRFEFPNAYIIDGMPTIAIGLIDMTITNTG